MERSLAGCLVARRAPPPQPRHPRQAVRHPHINRGQPYLEIAPFLIAVFAERYGQGPDGARSPHYYVTESVGIATGFLLAALHHAGLATLTHTPNPMGFLNEILERPPNERAMVLIVAGYPAPGVRVPDLRRKPLSAIATIR